MYLEQAATTRIATVSCCRRLFASQSPSSANEQQTEYTKGKRGVEKIYDKSLTKKQRKKQLPLSAFPFVSG